MFRTSSVHHQERPYNVKLITAQQAKIIRIYENIKMKLYKCIAAIWYNKTCKLRHLTPRYIHITINGNNLQCRKTKSATIKNKNSPDDGPMRSETCRANKKGLLKLTHEDHTVYLVGLHVYYKMIHGPYNVKTPVSIPHG